MREEIQKALKDMESLVVFDPKKHTYKIKATGEWLQGVSKISSIVPKDWLAAWGAKEAVKFLGYSDYPEDTERAKEVLKLIKGLDLEQYQALLKDAKGASGRKSKTALVDGKAGHAWLEDYVKARINKTDLPVIPEGSLQRPINQFLEWEKENILEWIASEAMIVNIEDGYAGTLDAIAVLKNGELAIVDFKFASHISEDYFLQCAGYSKSFDKYGINIKNIVIIRLPKTLEKEEWNAKEFKYYMVPNNIEVVYVDNIELHKEVFVHCIPVKKWINTIIKK